MSFAPELLSGKVILVTGASSGLGRDFAIAASRLGARIAAVGRDQSELDRTLEQCKGSGHLSIAHTIEAVDAFKEVVTDIASEAGPLFGAFHSAGVHILESIRRSSSKSFDDVFKASFAGSVGLIAACARKPVMEQGGRIVLMSSVSGSRSLPGLAMYGASKAAVSHYAQSAASELAKKRVTINCIVAGNIVTEMHRRSVDMASKETRENLEGDHPLGFGEPADVTAAALFLMSPGAKWITGTDVTVDGGYLSR